MTGDTGIVGTLSDAYARFRIGRGLAIVSPPTFVLVDPVNGAFGERLWKLMQDDGGVDALLEELSAAGLRSLGDFAMAQIEEDELRVVVRGQAQVVVSIEGESIVLEAGSVKTWVEAVFEGVTGFALSIGPTSQESLVYRMGSGIAPADQLHWGDFHYVVPLLETLEMEWTDDFEPTDVGQSRSALGGVVQARQPSRVPDPEGDPSEKPDGAPVVSDDGVEDDYDFDALYGRTVVKSVQGAAVAPPVEEGQAGVSADNDSSGAGADEDPGSVTDDVGDLTLVPPAGTSDGSGLISMVPGRGAPMPSTDEGSSPREEVDSSDDDQLGDHDGMTISMERLREMRQQSGSEGQEPGATRSSGPSVQALVCLNGHANPTHLERCTRCDAVLDMAPTVVPRPTMGRLVFSTGLTIDLDRPVIIGRNPKVQGSMPNEMPQLVRFKDHDLLSRSHAMFQLESWHVLVEDLGSRNGTMVALPGRDPRLLMAGEPVMLEPGTVIEFADEVLATYHGSG